MGIINIHELSFHYTGEDILSDITFEINKGEKIGLIGSNGSGKTTLLKLIAGDLSPVTGSIYIQKDLLIGYLSQSLPLDEKRTVFEEALSTFDHLIRLEALILKLSSEIDSQRDANIRDKLVYKLSESNEEYIEKGGATYINRTKAVLRGLGFDNAHFDKKTKALSAGQKTRLCLAKLLLGNYDILLLDEPTNHLDFDSISWLEEFVKMSSETIVCVSHDRYFLDEVTNKTAEIEDTRLITYNGNYSRSREQKKENLYANERAYNKQASEIKRLKEVINKLRQFNREKSIKRARSFEKKLERIDTAKSPLTKNNSIKLSFTEEVKKSHDILATRSLSKRYGDIRLFDDLSISLYRGDRLFVIGPNGSGKSTFLKILNGDISPDKGTYKIGSTLNYGYFDQDQRFDDQNKSVFDEIYDDFPDLNVQQISNVLAGMLFFGDDLNKRIADLSGGEKSRLSLLKLILSYPDFIILDEPTNHLDLTSRERLEEALLDFQGTLLVVSHDRYFISRLAKSILLLDNGEHKYYRNGFDDYLADRQAIMARIDSSDQEISDGKAAFLESKKKQAYIRKLESDVIKLKEEMAEIEKHIYDLDKKIKEANDTHDYETLMALTNQKDEKETHLLVILDKASDFEDRLKQECKSNG